MKSVEYLIGGENILKNPVKPMTPYSESALNFCETLSRLILKSPAARTYPDLSALAFWCRKANLKILRDNCPDAAYRLGRGLCFHIAPGNIPVNFAFSYLFGLLSGCANIVRLSSRKFQQADLLCDFIRDILENFLEIAAGTAFVRYAPDDEINAYFSAKADVRLIWGGDATIQTMRRIKTKPRCLDVCFADRYSICVLDAEAILNADEAALSRLADGFYNDTWLMDQNACSSPQMIFWTRDNIKGRMRFWDAAFQTARKKYILPPSVSVDKYTRLCENAIENIAIKNINRAGNLLYRLELDRLPDDLTRLRGESGYFYEYALKSLDDLTPYVTEKFQTVTCFGIRPEDLRDWVISNRISGIDRIVPVGKALDIGILWDGYQLAETLSRIVSVY